MGMTIVEKILANHSKFDVVNPGQIIDVLIDARVARDFGGPNVVKNLEESNMSIHDASKTFFTFDTNPTGSDMKYAVNQHICRQFARKHNVKIFDINNGIGTHTLMELGLAYPGSTAVSTDSHANIMGAVCSFGQGMGDQDIAAVWANGSIWFKVPASVKITLNGKRPENVTAKDIVLNLLHEFGANSLLGYSIELYGEEVDKLSLDERITISSMATEMGAIILFIPPTDEIYDYFETRLNRKVERIFADKDAVYEKSFDLNISDFKTMVSLPGKPHGTVNILEAKKRKIDSAFIGSCTNGRIEDLRVAANILKGRIVAPGVVLKIVPSTDIVWQQAMDEGLIRIFKEAGALVSNAGCAGCAAGQVGMNGPGEITISTGNRNFPGKQGKGEVYLASPAVVAASAIAGYITTIDDIPETPANFDSFYVESKSELAEKHIKDAENAEKKAFAQGKVWLIDRDNIDTDMIFHNRYLAITNIDEMGQYAFDNLEGYEDFAKKVKPTDIVVTGKNFGSGSSRQQAVDCFKALGVPVILAQSYGAIYERNAINAAMPIMVCDLKMIEEIGLKNGDELFVDFETGKVENKSNGKTSQIEPFSEVQLDIYQKGGLF
ncbi:MAG: 3-isopropylmalate dehydratase large subunit [Bacteroidales bacterium]|nr:3-isopropylmalate dehydratase large subunit [Bacteroidales bacterium]